MKKTNNFQPSKEVMEILREIEKQKEDVFNKIRKEMGPLAYSRLMGMWSKKEVDDFFESLTAANFSDFTPSLIDVFRKIESKRIRKIFLTQLQQKLAELDNALNRNEEYATFRKHAEALIFVGKEQFALEVADKDIKTKKSFFLYRAEGSGCVVRANIEVLKESLESLGIIDKEVEIFYINGSMIGSGIRLSALEALRLMDYLEKRGWDMAQYRPLLFNELRFNYNTEFETLNELSTEKDINEFFSICAENAPVLTPGTFIRYFPMLKGKLLRLYEKRLKLFFAHTPDISEICKEWFVKTDFSIEKKLDLPSINSKEN